MLDNVGNRRCFEIKKYWKMAVIIAVCVFVAEWMVMGIKLLDHDYDIFLEAYMDGGCWLIVIVLRGNLDY